MQARATKYLRTFYTTTSRLLQRYPQFKPHFPHSLSCLIPHYGIYAPHLRFSTPFIKNYSKNRRPPPSNRLFVRIQAILCFDGCFRGKPSVWCRFARSCTSSPSFSSICRNFRVLRRFSLCLAEFLSFRRVSLCFKAICPSPPHFLSSCAPCAPFSRFPLLFYPIPTKMPFLTYFVCSCGVEAASSYFHALCGISVRLIPSSPLKSLWIAL